MRKYFGNRIATVRMLMDTARAAKAAGATNVGNKEQVKIIAQVIVSVLIVGGGIYLLGFSAAGETLKETAVGWIGLVVGYWIS